MNSELGNHPCCFFLSPYMLVFGYIYLGRMIHDPFFAHSYINRIYIIYVSTGLVGSQLLKPTGLVEPTRGVAWRI